MESCEINLICRVCLNHSNDLKNLATTTISYDNESVSLLDVLNSFLSDAVIRDDDQLLTICLDCYTSAIAAYDFKRLCNNSHHRLINYYEFIRRASMNVEIIDIKDELLETEEKPLLEILDESDYRIENECSETEEDSYERACKESQNANDYEQNSSDESENSSEDGQNCRVKVVRYAYPCHICNEIFPSRVLLCVHCKDVHNMGVVKIKNKQYCTICTQHFEDFSQMQVHYLSHAGKRPHLCQICGQSFSRSLTLSSHMKATHDGKAYRCQICHQTSTSWKNLRKHTYSFLTDRYKCRKCDAAFCNWKTWKMHDTCRACVKPYVCKECGLRYPNEDDLDVHHRRAHLRCSCDKCGMSFTGTATLKFHDFFFGCPAATT